MRTERAALPVTFSAAVASHSVAGGAGAEVVTATAGAYAARFADMRSRTAALLLLLLCA